MGLAIGWSLAGCTKNDDAQPARKVFVLGCDGMDPKLVRKLMDAGRMPNFAKLASEGGFWPLITSIPPQSPVAWSNFITGADPGVHGIFDFIHRDPVHQALPYFSTNRIVEGEHKEPWMVGKYEIPSGGATNELLRRGTPFWNYLDERGIPVRMYHLPANYPPSKSDHGHACCLSGMGVPDALGSQGIYQHFTSAPRPELKAADGMRLRFTRDKATGVSIARLQGPPNEFLSKRPPLTVDIQVHPDKTNNVAKLVYVNQGVAANETVEFVLNTGEWSDWHEVHFLKTPVGPIFRTMVRFYLQSVRPDIELFVTPLNFVPGSSDVVISEPPSFAGDIAKEMGPFYTIGFAEQFNARKHEILSDEEYKTQADQVFNDSIRMLDHAIDEFRAGLLFFYFSSTDLQAHIYWWEGDEKHPVRSPDAARKYNAVIEALYCQVDTVLGKARERLGNDTPVLVMSDHGFANFRRCVGLTTWLKREGYLSAASDVTRDADWTNTRAFGLGLNGLYVNLKGREKLGIVEPGQRDALLKEISARLLALRDPQNGSPVVRRVYRAEEVYHGAEVKNAPDLIVGYERGYRASWNTCLGQFDDDVVIDNNQAWSADHCIAHDLVPGVLLSNRRIGISDPALIDIAPTLLGLFDVQKPATMTGRSLFDAGAAIAAR